MIGKPRLSAALTFALAAAVPTAHAKCVYRPEIQADVTVSACVAATFEASEVRSSTFAPDLLPLYRSADRTRGVILTVTVIGSRFVWPQSVPHHVNGQRLWARNELRSVFVAASANTACPPTVPVRALIVSKTPCCDTLPYSGECLVPTALVPVEILKMGSIK